MVDDKKTKEQEQFLEKEIKDFAMQCAIQELNIEETTGFILHIIDEFLSTKTGKLYLKNYEYLSKIMPKKGEKE